MTLKRRYLAPCVVVEIEVGPLPAKRLILHPLSAWGQSRRFADVRVMSALLLKASKITDIAGPYLRAKIR